MLRYESDQAQSAKDLKRARQLASEGVTAQQEVEHAENKHIVATKELEAAKFRVRAAASDVEREKAGLVSLESREGQAGKLVEIRPPTVCRILRILRRASAWFPSGRLSWY